MPSPMFVSFEGGEGSGKSTQAELLHARLWDAGIRATLVHEPGSTPLGWHLREYLKGGQPLSKEAELLLFEAARVELVSSQIESDLRNGFLVIADRFEASSIAYQGYGRNIDISFIGYLNSFTTKGHLPDLTFLLDLDPVEGLRRIGNPQLTLPLEGGEPVEPGRLEVAGQRRFEDQPLQFQERVRAGYLKMARDDPERWIVIDAVQTVAEISTEIWQCIAERLDLSVETGLA